MDTGKMYLASYVWWIMIHALLGVCWRHICWPKLSDVFVTSCRV